MWLNYKSLYRNLGDDIKIAQCVGNLPNEDSYGKVSFILILESLNEIWVNFDFFAHTVL